jgi:LCP family protein required for cell wall assembly
MGQDTADKIRDNKTQQGSSTRQQRRTATKSGRKTRRHLCWLFILLVCFLSYPRAKALLGAGRPRPTPGESPTAEGIATRTTRDINILLLGVDERPGDVGRSDTMILVNYNALYNSLHVMSIPRDTRVNLPKYGYQKINAAYAYGGAELAKQAVSDLTGLYIDHHAKVNFDGFAKVVDALGGVTIEIEEVMDYRDPYQDLHIHFEPGVQHLSGTQALEYVRWRGDPRADLGRVERQRRFLSAAVRKAMSPAGIIRLPLVLLALEDCVETDIPPLEQPGLLASIAVAHLKGATSVTLPGTTASIGGGSYFIADSQELSAMIESWNLAPWAKRD